MDTRYLGYRIYLALSGKFVVTVDDKDARTKRKFRTEEEAKRFIESLPKKS